MPAINSPAFRQWFGESQVVDDHGQPLIVYHGTPARFSAFKVSKDGFYGAGIYFTNSKDAAQSYGEDLSEDETAVVMSVNLSLKNPYVFNAPPAMNEPSNVTLARELLSDQDLSRLITRLNAGNWYNPTVEFKARLESMGYDGLVVNAADEPSEYIAFHPEQVRIVPDSHNVVEDSRVETTTDRATATRSFDRPRG